MSPVIVISIFMYDSYVDILQKIYLILLDSGYVPCLMFWHPFSRYKMQQGQILSAYQL